jgi:DNA-binding GntR family transcriptional regulator
MAREAGVKRTSNEQPRPEGARPRMSANEIVTEFIRLIRQRVYHPGDRVREQELADRFGVSRGPVREALRILEAKAILAIEPMRGATVARLSDAETRETVDIAAVLFGLAARQASARATPDERAAIVAAAEGLGPDAERDIAPRRFYVETVRVGELVAAASRSPRLTDLLRDVRTGWPNILGALGFTTRALRRKAATKWQRMAAAIAKGDAPTAERLAIEVHHDVAAEAFRVTL